MRAAGKEGGRVIKTGGRSARKMFALLRQGGVLQPQLASAEFSKEWNSEGLVGTEPAQPDRGDEIRHT